MQSLAPPTGPAVAASRPAEPAASAPGTPLAVIAFAGQSANLTEATRAQLDQIAKRIAELGVRQIEVRGYAFGGIDGRKVAGILAEVSATAPDPAVVVGIGLNVSLTRDELPVEHATSLVLEGTEVSDRDTLVRAVLRAIADRWQQWHDANWDVTGLAEAYRARCGTLGQRVRAELPGGRELIGIATDVDAEGRVVIAPDGQPGTIAVAAGDITHLRPVRTE